MIRKQYAGLIWYEFELLADQPLIHGTFTRHGGVSRGPLESLNLGRSVGDEASHLFQNLEKVKQALNITCLSRGRLSHGKEIASIDDESDDPIADGRSTNRPALGLLMTHADCQAAIFYDPINHAVANIHCGWRGNVQNIYASAIAYMGSQYYSKPQDLLVCISPSLGPEHAEFINYKTELPENFWEFQIRPNYFDLWSISRMQLINSGVLPHHIQIAAIDTFGNDDYFSYRRAKNSGRQGTVCALI